MTARRHSGPVPAPQEILQEPRPADPDATRVVFLGGAGEIGRNMTVIEHGGRMLVIDVGLMFPTEEMLGVDLVLPDFEYLRDPDKELVGIVLTHGHEDHVGGLPYFLKEFGGLRVPIVSARLTLGLLAPKLEEHGLLAEARLKEVKLPGKLTLGPFKLQFFRVTHSIPDGMATVIETPAGRLFHTGDFKLDPTPIDGNPTDLQGIGAAAAVGIDLMLSDSTNAEVPGQVPSERTVGEAISKVVKEASGRVIVACFASNIHRVQQIVTAAEASGRLVAFFGRSMHTNVRVTRELGYLKIPDDMVIPIEDIDSYPPNQICVISTGSQGEPLAALSLMAAREHKWIKLTASDTVVISATVIPGNESAVRRVVDGLFRIGCEVVRPPVHVHVSGHGAAEELKFMLDLVKPDWFVPVHGEYRHMATHARLGHEVGIPPSRTVLVEDGDIIELKDGKLEKVDRIHAGFVYVDGLGIGDVGQVVLRDRRLLSQDGVIVCVVTVDSQTGELLAGPDLTSRGFVYEDQASEFLEQAREAVRASLAELAEDEISDWGAMRRHVRKSLGKFLWNRTGRKPIILPVVVEM
ncbi:MAG: ribonuclease J [Actinomycetota bacterium]